MVLNHLLLIITYVIINLRQVESYCPKPEIWPKDTFLYENEQLILSCTIKDEILSKGTLELRRIEENQRDDLLPISTTVNNNTHLTIQLNDTIKAPANPYIYFLFYECVYKSTYCSEVEITSVAFDAYPRKPQHISCVIYDKEGIKCEIDLDGSYRLGINSGLTKEIKVTVKMQAPSNINRNNWVPGECEHTYKKAFVICTWKVDTNPYTVGRYTFNVSVVNTFRYDSVYSIFEEDVYDVKPDLVRNVTITTNTIALVVTWKHDFKGSVGYEIQLRSHGICWETAKTQHTGEHFVVFNDLESYSSYNISIIAYPMNEDRKRLKYNSDPVYSQTMTKADVPESNPKLHFGSFRVADDGQVYIYWTPLKDCQANGPGLVYEILLFEPNDLLSNETKTATGFSAILSINRSRTYMVYIKSRNSVGYAIHDPSHLQISNQRPRFPKSVIVEWIRNRTVSVSWLPSESSMYDTSDYTVYWCRAKDSYIWKEPISAHIVLSKTTAATVTMSSLDFDKHIFGVSTEMETTGQLISSGIQWSTCYYSRYALPLNPMETALKYTDDGVNITWVTYQCSRRYGRNVMSIIYFKNEDSRIVKKIPVSSSKGFFIVRNIPPGSYKFSVAGRFLAGMGPPSKDISFHVYVVHSPTNRQIIWALILPVAVGGLIIVAVSIVLAVKIRNYCREAAEATRDFDFTEIEGNQQSTSLEVKMSESLKDSGISATLPCEIQSNANDQHDETICLLHGIVQTTCIGPRRENVSEVYVETAELENTTKDQNGESGIETTELLSQRLRMKMI